MDEQRRSALLGLLGIGAALAVPSALARGRAGFRMRGLPAGARHKGPILSREQLRQCVVEQGSINAAEVEVEKAQASIATSEASLTQLEAQINPGEPLVDHYSQASVDAFNALIDKHRRLVAAHNAKLPSANAKVQQVNAAVQRFNAKCADRVYYESDMRAVLAGK